MIFLPDPYYNPNFIEKISSKTKLAPGVTMAKFMGSPGTRMQFEQYQGDTAQLARNLYLHAQLIRQAVTNTDFNKQRLIVSEGVYEEGNPESGDGRLVAYQLINQKGKTDIAKSFDLAVYWKDYGKYKKITLDYDTYDPSGDLTCQIVVEVPTVPESFDITFDNVIETVYNGKLQSKNEFLEIKA